MAAIAASTGCGLISQAAAQTPAHAPIPENGQLVEQPRGKPISDQISTGGLPGVNFDDTGADRPVRGPGGLQNGVGAVGLAAPSMSSSNPVPLEDTSADRLGIPLGPNPR